MKNLKDNRPAYCLEQARASNLNINIDTFFQDINNNKELKIKLKKQFGLNSQLYKDFLQLNKIGYQQKRELLNEIEQIELLIDKIGVKGSDNNKIIIDNQKTVYHPDYIDIVFWSKATYYSLIDSKSDDPVKQKQIDDILSLYYSKALPPKEIAKILNLPKNRVTYLLNRNKLYELYE